MQYVDKLNQDEYSLSRPTFPTPKGGVLTVVGWKGKQGSAKKYIVKCDLCSHDPELFGEGTFSSTKGNLTLGQVPCGCASNPRWTESQFHVRISREATARGLEFMGWASEYNSNKTKLLLSCPLHGEWNSTSVAKFLRGVGCPTCKVETHLKEDRLHINQFMGTGVFLEGTTFWRSERKNKQGWAVYWKYTCPLCSSDEYVKAGLCSGVFESYACTLKRGQPSCRCAKNYRWTKEQREYQINREIKRGDNNTADYKFVSWISNYKNAFSKFKYLCKEHGEQSINVDDFLNGGKGCPECKGKTQCQAYINVVKDGDTPVALKLGIANSSPNRLKIQNRTNLFKMVNIGVWEFPTVQSCREAEAYCKRVFECSVLSCRELRDGWTETTYLQNLDAIIRIYEKHGGIRMPS